VSRRRQLTILGRLHPIGRRDTDNHIIGREPREPDRRVRIV
jgi:hypothetical protein